MGQLKLISYVPAFYQLPKIGYRPKGYRSVGCFEELYPNRNKFTHSDSLFGVGVGLKSNLGSWWQAQKLKCSWREAMLLERPRGDIRNIRKQNQE